MGWQDAPAVDAAPQKAKWQTAPEVSGSTQSAAAPAAAPAAPAPAVEPAAAPPPSPRGRRGKHESPSSDIKFTTGHLAQGMMAIPGLPADTLENALNLGAAGFHALSNGYMGRERTPFSPPFRESPLTTAWLQRQGEKVGIEAPEPQSGPGRYYAAGLRMAPMAALGRPTLQQAPKAVGGAFLTGPASEAAGDIGGETAKPFGPLLTSMLPGAHSLRSPPTAGERATTQRQGEDFAKSRRMGLTVPPRDLKPDRPQQKLQDTAIKDLKLPEGTELSKKTLNAYSNQHYADGYEPLATAAELRGGLVSHGEFQAALQKLGDEITAGNNRLPETFKSSKGAIDLLAEYGYGQQPQGTPLRTYDRATGTFRSVDTPPAMEPLPTDVALRAIKKNRDDAATNFASDKPEQQALAKVQKGIANALENLIDENLARTGNQQLLQNYRTSRTQIAKAHDTLEMIDPKTGKISPNRAAALQDERPLSGGMKDISDVSRAFPNAVKEPLSQDLFTHKVTPMAMMHPVAMLSHWASRMGEPITRTSGMQHFYVDPRSRLSPEAARAVRYGTAGEAAQDYRGRLLEPPPEEPKKKKPKRDQNNMIGVRG